MANNVPAKVEVSPVEMAEFSRRSMNTPINNDMQWAQFEQLYPVIDPRKLLLDDPRLATLPALISGADLCLFKIDRLSYEAEFPRREAFENVIASVNDSRFNFVYLLVGTGQEVDFYFGVSTNHYHKNSSRGRSETGTLEADDLRSILKNSFLGNFKGSRLKVCEGFEEPGLSLKEIDDRIFKSIDGSKHFSMVRGIPSINKEASQELAGQFQGVDRLINTMQGHRFQLLIVCEPEGQEDILFQLKRLYELYSELQASSKTNVSKNRTDGTSSGEGENWGKNKGAGESRGSNSSDSSSYSSSGTNSGQSKNWGTSEGGNTSTGTSISEGVTISYEAGNKQAVAVMEYLDKELLERYKLGRGKGLYSTAIYLASNTPEAQLLLENSVKSLFQGDQSSFHPLTVQRFADAGNAEARSQIQRLMKNFQVYRKRPEEKNPNLLPLFSIPVTDVRQGKASMIGLSTLLTARELSLIAGLPQREVAGIALVEEVDFGLNVPEIKTHDTKSGKSGEAPAEGSSKAAIDLGYMLQGGFPMKNRKVSLGRDHLNKHTFIAGVTGSGKTTTCQKLLLESGLPFLVIEPAKTEYRQMIPLLEARQGTERKGLMVFTLGNEKCAPFRLNPFEFSESESITGHADLLKAAFIAAFDMEAAIPQIIEQAIYHVYKKFGWDISDDSNRYLEKREMAWREESGRFFPTLTDFMVSVTEVVESMGFDARLKGDYLGSLRGRLNSLMVGTKGQMLNVRRSVDFKELLQGQVVLELEELKNSDDKSFVMALVLMRLSEALRDLHREKPKFKHITLVEEAHRLLSRPKPGEGGSRQKGVEMFADMLAEVRKYGEALVIVDQIPNKLTPEVLKNTNTKIIHKIFAQDDKDALGECMALEDGQKDYLSYLDTGEAIVFSQGWNKPVYLKVERTTDTSGKEIEDSDVKKNAASYWQKNSKVFVPETFLLPSSGNLSLETLQELQKLVRSGLKVFRLKTPEELKKLQPGFKTNNSGDGPSQFQIEVRQKEIDAWLTSVAEFCKRYSLDQHYLMIGVWRLNADALEDIRFPSYSKNSDPSLTDKFSYLRDFKSSELKDLKASLPEENRLFLSCSPTE